MKKIFLFTSLISVLSYGASIDHIQTYSPDYLANQAQTGMINSVSANYNPAGLSHLEKGRYIHTGLQFAFGHETMKYNGRTHKAKLKQAIPNISLYSVDDKGATFLTFGGIAGGGKLKYDGASGVDVVIEQFAKKESKKLRLPLGKLLGAYDKGSQVEGSNKYEQLTLGRAYQVNDKLSLSIAGRIVHGTRKLSGNLNLGVNPRLKEDLQAFNLPQPLSDEINAALPLLANGLNANINSEREAYGLGFQLGLNYKYSEKLNLAARYDSKINLNFKAKGSEKVIAFSKVPLLDSDDLGFTKFYPQYTPNTKTRRDLPAILALGASYQATDRWLISTAGNFYFNRQAKMDRVPGHTANYKNGWELALGNEYKINEKFTLIGSINYAKTGAPKSSYNDTEYALDSTTLGAGLRYNYDETLTLTASAAHFIYNTSEGNFKERYSPVIKENQKYKKSITAFGLSITKKF